MLQAKEDLQILSFYSKYNFTNFKDEQLKLFINDNKKLLDTTKLEYTLFGIQKTNKDEFITVLYNLIVALKDIYGKLPFYGFHILSKSMQNLILDILAALTYNIITKNNNKSDIDKIIDSLLSRYKDTSKVEIMRYFDMIGNE